MVHVELFTKLLRKAAEFQEGEENAIFEQAADDLEKRSREVVATSK